MYIGINNTGYSLLAVPYGSVAPPGGMAPGGMQHGGGFQRIPCKRSACLVALLVALTALLVYSFACKYSTHLMHTTAHPSTSDCDWRFQGDLARMQWQVSIYLYIYTHIRICMAIFNIGY